MERMLEEKRLDLEVLCQKYRVSSLEIFGSAAIGNFNDATSDLDFLVDFKADHSMDLADQYFGLLAELEKLFDRKIDLVMARAMKNPYFIKSVEASRRALFAA